MDTPKAALSAPVLKDGSSGRSAAGDGAAPFALSNAAFSRGKDTKTPTQTAERRMSPGIERALHQLELKEAKTEARRNRDSSDGSGKRDFSSVYDDSDVERAASAKAERRVFTAESDEEISPDQKEDSAEEGKPDADSPALSDKQTASTAASEPPATPSSASATSSRRSVAPRVSSLAAPRTEPRMTKSAALRLGIPWTPQARRSVAASLAAAPASLSTSATRPPPLALKSLATPTLTPRATKASALRAGPGHVASPIVTKKREAITTAQRAAQDKERRQSLAASALATSSVAVAQVTKAVEIRMTKTAALRAGQPVLENRPALRQAMTEGTKPTVSHGDIKRRQSMPVASSARPVIEPRLSRAAMLRLGMPVEPAPRRTSVLATAKGEPIVPRRASLAASKPPSITPRLNRAILLRQGATAPAMKSSEQPVPRSRASITPLTTTRTDSRASSTSAGLSTSAASTNENSKPRVGHHSSRGPAIAPRLNKAAQLRQAKQSEDKDVVAQQSLHKKRTSSAAVPVLRKVKTSALSEVSNAT